MINSVRYFNSSGFYLLQNQTPASKSKNIYGWLTICQLTDYNKHIIAMSRNMYLFNCERIKYSLLW